MSLEPSPSQVAGQLRKILADPLFEKSQRLAGFLRFVVETALAGRAAELKEYTIGVAVFHKSGDYNPQVEPGVRIMAGRLRAKLAEYYIGAGAGDEVLIELPRGGYVPRFVSRIRVPAPEPRPFRRSVGRHAELARLRGAFSALVDGGRIIAVSGDAGLGKTTIVEDFLAELPPGTVVSRGRCSERLAETDAFAPLIEALDALSRSGAVPGGLLESVAPAWHALVTGESRNNPPSQERIRREIASFFEQLARTSPVVLFLDDLHWSDASTCDLLAYLGRRLRSLPVLIVTTFRPGAVLVPGVPFLPLKLTLEREGVCEEISLSFLTRADVSQYIAQLFPEHRFPEGFGAIIHERTEGNPLFLTSLLRYLVDSGVLTQRDGAWILVGGAADIRCVIPAGTHAMIGLKIGSLPGADRDILLCGAVQGVEFDSAVIVRVLAMDAEFVEERLRDLDRIHRLVTAMAEQDQPGRPLSVRYRFVHVFYQNALYSSLTPSRRASESLAVAAALVDLAGPEASRLLAAELAVLYESGRDSTNAAQCFLGAARNAARVFAYPEVALLCERGLRSLALLPASRRRDEQELMYLLTRGIALMSTRGYAAPEVEQTYRRARDLCLELNEIRRLVPVLWGIHTCLTNAARLPESLEVAQQMRLAADSLGQDERVVESLHALGTTLAFMGRLAEARAALERVLEISPPARHEFTGNLYVLDPLVTSLSMLARLLTLMGDLDAGLKMALDSVTLANRLAHPHGLAYATFWVGWILHARGEPAPACPHLEAAMSLAGANDLPLIAEWVRVVRGSALAQLGRREEGIAAMRQSLRTQESMGSQLGRPYCQTLLAEALLAAGSPEEALSLCHAALERATHTGELDFTPEAHRLRAEALLASGDPGSRNGAEAAYETGFSIARQHRSHLLENRLFRSFSAFRAAAVANHSQK